MKFWNKIKQILLQILLLPVSTLIEITGGLCVLYIIYCIVSCFTRPSPILLFEFLLVILVFWSHVLARPFTAIIFHIKDSDSYDEYTDSGIEYTRMESVQHEITDTSGTVVGYYESTEPVTHYEMSDEEFGERLLYILYCSVALPCRIISLLLSIVALFTNKFFVSVRRPVNCRDNPVLHKYFDLVIPRKDT